MVESLNVPQRALLKVERLFVESINEQGFPIADEPWARYIYLAESTNTGDFPIADEQPLFEWVVHP
jgi:hypothetical protein